MEQNFSKAFLNGIKYFNKSNYSNARKWFEISYHSLEFRERSLFKLISIDLKEGKYADARERIEENLEYSSIQIKQLYGLLECIENNFETSKHYYEECLEDKKMQNDALLAIAKLYIQTGDNDIGRKILEILQSNPSFKVSSTIELVCLNVHEQNYKDAEKLLKSIDEERHYTLHMYVKYFLNRLNPSDNHYDPIRNYKLYRLFDQSEETLLTHIQKHTRQEDKKSKGCFFEHIDFKELLMEVREKMEDINPNYFKDSDKYQIQLDRPIGFKGEKETHDLCVITMMGTKNILTMYPILLSDEFDKEGFLTSKELMLKRNNRGMKKNNAI